MQSDTGGDSWHAKLTKQWGFDRKENDILWCTADVGWITGHSYVAYGPLAAGATVMMYEGAPTYPHGGRFWEICKKHQVTIFYTAPTAIRAVMKMGNELPNSYDLSSIRLLGTVGEPINPEAWIWYHKTIGKKNCPIVDTWWQTETGGIMIRPLPSETATKPGSCPIPLPGIFTDIVDESGNPVTEASQGGYLFLSRPWPSMLITIWADNDRYMETYVDTIHDIYYYDVDSC